MDILYSSNVEGFCIVSSDSDFTKLAVRLRESGMMVIGMGEKKTPKPFSTACNIFKYLDILTEDAAPAPVSAPDKDDARGSKEPENMTDIDTIQKAIVNIINENGDEDAGIGIGELGDRLLKRYPRFRRAKLRIYQADKISFHLRLPCVDQGKKHGVCPSGGKSVKH